MTARPAPAGPSHARPAPGAAVLAALVLALSIAVLVAACGSSATPATPGASASRSDDSGGPAPSATPWPGGVVEAVMTLGKADAEIQAAGADLGAAAADQDLEAMWGAADGLATLLGRLQGEIPRIAAYPATADAATAYDAAFPDMLAGATQLRDAIKAGDAAGIGAGSQRLAKGLEQYRYARRLIGPLVDQALLMQRLLVK